MFIYILLILLFYFVFHMVSHMVESFTLGYINPNNDVGYYASEFSFFF